MCLSVQSVGVISPSSASCVLISLSFERSASPHVASAMLLNKVVYVVVKIFLERGRKFLSHFRSNDLLRRTIAPQVVSIVVK